MMPVVQWVHQRPLRVRGRYTGGRRQISIHLSHSLAAPFGSLCLLLLPLDTRFIIESPFFDLREKPFLGQFLLEIPYGFFNLIVLYNNFHNPISLFIDLDNIIE